MLQLLSLSGVNEIVELSYFPVDGNCPDSGRDANCTGDRYLACVLDTECNGASCGTPQQLEFARFLHCLEAENQVDMDAADDCAHAAGFDVSAVRRCFDNHGAREAAIAAAMLRISPAVIEEMRCFPWVVLDGEALSDQPEEGCLGGDAGSYPLIDDVCRAASERGLAAPPACDGNAAI